MNYYTRMAQFSYRLAFVAAMLTYGIVVYKTLRARAKAGMKFSPQVAVSLIADENVQYFRAFSSLIRHDARARSCYLCWRIRLTFLFHSPGVRVALGPSVPNRLAALQRLLHLPLRNLHSLHRHPDYHPSHPSCARGRCFPQREAPVQHPPYRGRYRQLRQGVLRHVHVRCFRP